MNIIILSLTLYSIISSIFIFFIFYLKTDLSKDFKKIEESIEKSNSSDKEKIKLMISLEKHKASSTPWYMSSISTIGIVAFFSMMLATLIQTINVTKETFTHEKLKMDIDKLMISKNEADSIIDSMTYSSFANYARDGVLTESETRIINYKISILEMEKPPNDLEIYKLSMLTHNLAKAREAISSVDTKSQIKGAPDKISLAQFYFLTGNKDESRKIITDTEKSLSSLSTYWKFQLVVLKSLVVKDSYEDQIRLTSTILRLNRENAKHRLDKERKILIKHIN